MPDLSFSYDGQRGMLNPHLVERQGVAERDIEALRATHVTRKRIFADMQAAESTEALLRLAREFDALEYQQQRLWGFPLDRNHHQWHSVPQCSCPSYLNFGLRGTPLRLVSRTCVVHSRLLCDDGTGTHDCELCPSMHPRGSHPGEAVHWVRADPALACVNVDCSVHGRALLELRLASPATH
jgi:hypothetical protein